MTTFPNSPKVIKVGIVLVDAKSGTTLNMITTQYNPDSLSRKYDPHKVSSQEISDSSYRGI